MNDTRKYAKNAFYTEKSLCEFEIEHLICESSNVIKIKWQIYFLSMFIVKGTYDNTLRLMISRQHLDIIIIVQDLEINFLLVSLIGQIYNQKKNNVIYT